MRRGASMKKLVLSALVKPRRDGVTAEVAEFPDIKVSALSVAGAIARLREALWHRMRWTRVKQTSCHGEPIEPVPRMSQSGEVTVPMEVEVTTGSEPRPSDQH